MAAGRHLGFRPGGHHFRSGLGHFQTQRPQKHKNNLDWLRNYLVHWTLISRGLFEFLT